MDDQAGLIAQISAALNGKSGGGGAAPVIQALSVTENGTYTAPSGVDGYSPVTVQVPNPSSGSIRLTENGTYDVTEKAEAVVSIPVWGGVLE